MILSHRYQRQGKDASKLPVSRQRDAANQIATIMSDENSADLILLPFVPYSLSISLSVTYRELRFSRLTRHKSEARKKLHQICASLGTLGTSYWSAALMAEMTQSILLQTSHTPLPSRRHSPSTQARRDAQNQREDTTMENISSADPGFMPYVPNYDQTTLHLDELLGSEWNLDDMDCLIQDSFDPSIPAFMK